MADILDFQNALRNAILNKTAFCIHSHSGDTIESLKGGIIISRESNEIVWLAVSKQFRGMGLGRKLLEFAIEKLDRQTSIFVQTFDNSITEGKAARKLYMDFGFTDFKDGGLNPAGIPTVIMKLDN